jgi:prepilin signal peptidase PulO-like enzyme (type II secretory pathway)
MACLQCACILLALVSFSRAEDSNSKTTVFKFSPLNLDDNYIVIQPNVPITKSTDIQYACLICLSHLSCLLILLVLLVFHALLIFLVFLFLLVLLALLALFVLLVLLTLLDLLVLLVVLVLLKSFKRKKILIEKIYNTPMKMSIVREKCLTQC